MKTIKLPYKTTDDLSSIIKQYSNIVRYSYNRFLDGASEKDIRKLSKSLKSVDLLNSWIIQCAIKEGKAIWSRFGDKKVIFGNKLNLVKRLQNKITKHDYQLKRMHPVSIQAERLKYGNRCFSLDIIDGNRIIFKLNRNNHFEFKLPKLRTNIKDELIKLQQLNEVKQNEIGYKFSVKFDLTHIYISFEEFKDAKRQLNKNRCLGIDMNPDTIGVSVLDECKVIYTQEFSLKPLFKKILLEKGKSNSDRAKHLHNKLIFETIEIAKSISVIAKRFNCENVFVESLHFKNPLGVKTLNRKNKNLWKKELFLNNLSKRLNTSGINLRYVNPAYSSFIGNIMHDYTDAVNASIEIARRGYEYKINKDKTRFYPSLLAKHQWKEMAAKFKDWKGFFLEIKNLKLKYRVSLSDVRHKFNVFQQNSNHKSLVLNYVFYG